MSMKNSFANVAFNRYGGPPPAVPKQKIMDAMIHQRPAAGKRLMAELSTALFITANTLNGYTNVDRLDIANDYLNVAFYNKWKHQDDDLRVISLLNALPRSSEWTIFDFHRVGFRRRVTKALEHLLQHMGEDDFSYITRCAQNKDSRLVKMAEIDFKMEENTHLMKPRDIMKHKALYEYLDKRERDQIPSTMHALDYVRKHCSFYKPTEEEAAAKSDVSPTCFLDMPDEAFKKKYRPSPRCKIEKGSAPILSKQELMAYIINSGQEANISTALMIVANALHNKPTWSGADYANHYIRVAFEGQFDRDESDEERKIIGILHDLVEDSDWTIRDLKAVGFSDRVIDGVRAVTKKKKGEKYFSFIERCSRNKDALWVKPRDLKHNSGHLRSKREPSDKQMDVYPIARAYLGAVKKKRIKAGSPIGAFIKAHYPEQYTKEFLEKWGGDYVEPVIEPAVLASSGRLARGKTGASAMHP